MVGNAHPTKLEEQKSSRPAWHHRTTPAMTLKILMATSLICFATSCDRAVGQHAVQTLVWDLSISNRLQAVNYPVPGPTDVWYVGGPGKLRLKMRERPEYEMDYWFAQVWPKKDRVRVRTLCIMLPPGTIDEVYQTAMKLAAEWDIKDVKEINTFKDTRARMIERGGRVYYLAARPDAKQGRSIEIRRSYAGREKPFYALLALAFNEDYDTPATTQKAQLGPP